MAKQHLFRRKPRPGQPANLTWHAWYVDAAGNRVRFSTGCTDKQAAAKVLAERERAAAAEAATGLAPHAARKTVEDALDTACARYRFPRPSVTIVLRAAAPAPDPTPAADRGGTRTVAHVARSRASPRNPAWVRRGRGR